MKEKLTEDGIEKVPLDTRVLDVRDSPEIRERIKEILKTNNAYKGSKFIKPSFSVMGRPYN